MPRRWAEMLGRRNAASFLDRSLKEDSQTDEQLNMIAEQANQSAKALSGRESSARASKKTAGANQTGEDAMDEPDQEMMTGREQDGEAASS